MLGDPGAPLRARWEDAESRPVRQAMTRAAAAW
jgi:hypothetical protein